MLIHGVITDERDVPIEWASVLFVEAPVELPDIAAITDDRGEFTVSVPAPGRYRLRCQAVDHQPATVTVDVTDHDVSISCRLVGVERPP
jgi:hypothetical protein